MNNYRTNRDDFIQRNANYFQSILGTLSDYTTKNTYDELESTLKAYGDKYNGFNKYKNVKKRVMDTNLTPEETDYLRNQSGIDLRNPELQTSEAYQNFTKDNPVPVNPITRKPEYDNPEYNAKFLEHLNNNYSNAGELSPDYKKYIKQTQIPVENLRGEDLIRAKMLKAGVSDEEKKIFDQFSNFDIENYNKNLEDNIYRNYPALVSRGPLGDQLAQVYGKRLKLNQIVDLPMDKKKVEFHDGWMFTLDDNGNVLAKEKIKEDKDYKMSTDAVIKTWTDENGAIQYGYFQPDPNAADNGYTGWKNTGVSSTERDYNYQEGLGEFAKKEKTGSKGRSGRSVKTGKEPKRIYSQEEKSLAKDLATLGEMNKSWESWQIKESDSREVKKEKEKKIADYNALKESLIEYTKGDYDLLNKYAEQVYTGTDAASVIDDLLGSSEQTDAEETAIDDIFNNVNDGKEATLIYEKHKDDFQTKAGKKYFKQKYLNKIGAK